jgi:hypothetical protein
MSISKVYVTTTAITAIVIAIATSTTITFPNVAIFATPLFGLEGNDTTTDTTTPPETAGQQEQQTIHITKDGTNSYILSGSSSSVGSFDTTYRIAGERSAIRSAENLIISTITHDFRNSPTIGYIRATGGGLGVTGTEATHPNPFATPQQITERITSELRSAITQAEGQHVEIKCDFGMSLEDMRCHHGPLPQARSG